jgi:hypothetical protein
MLADHAFSLINGHPGQGLVVEATHVATSKTQKVRVIPGATILVPRVSAEVPDPILALDAVGEPCLLQCRQRAVQGDAIQPVRPRRLGDLLVAKRTPSLAQQA